MKLRDLINLEITKPSERWKPHEYEGAELARVRLEAQRWNDWTRATFCFAIGAMYIPISIEASALILGLGSALSFSTVTWFALWTLLTVWSPVALYGFGPVILSRLIGRFQRPRTKFVEPPPFRGWLLYFVGWASSAINLVPLVLIMIVERSILDPLAEMVFLLEIAVLGWAGLLVARGLFLRLDDTICCRRCSYPMPSRTFEFPGLCSECGQDLSHRRGTMIGTRRFRPVSFVAGISIVLGATILRLL